MSNPFPGLTKERHQYWTTAAWPLAETQKHYWGKKKHTQKTRNEFWTECTRIKLAKLSVLWNFAVFNVNCPELALWVSLKEYFNTTITTQLCR